MRQALSVSLLALGLLMGCSDKSETEKYLDSLPEAEREKILTEIKAEQKATTEARSACATIIAEKSGGTTDRFYPDDSSDHPDEFYFAWPVGKIGGGRRQQPDVMTGSWEVSGMCIGSLGRREITSLTVNGVDVILPEKPIKF